MLRGVCRYLHLGYGSVLNAGTICGFDMDIQNVPINKAICGVYHMSYVQTHPYAGYMDDLRNDLLTQVDKIMQHGKKKYFQLPTNHVMTFIL